MPRWRCWFAVGEPTVPILAAGVVAIAAWLRAPVGALALSAVAGVVVGRWRVGMSIAAVALLVALRSTSAEDGLAADELGRYAGWATVAADPDPAFDATRLLLRLDGERFESWVRGRAAQLRVGAWTKGDIVWVDGMRRPLEPERADRVAWQHVVGAFDPDVLGDRLPGSRVDVASNRVRALITRATSWLPDDVAALARGLIIGDDSNETAYQVVTFGGGTRRRPVLPDQPRQGGAPRRCRGARTLGSSVRSEGMAGRPRRGLRRQRPECR